jgi:hypothetical protein
MLYPRWPGEPSVLDSGREPSREVPVMTRLVLLLTLLSAPLAAWAECPGSHLDQQAMSCAEGMQWSAETNACVPVVTG